LQPLLRPPLFVPDNTRIDQLLLKFREKHDTLAVVVDEFGATRGVVTLGNVLDLLVGDLLEENRLRAEQMFIPRRAHEWLVDGGMSLAELFNKLGVPELQAHAHAQVQTLGGLLLHELGRLPELGETLVWRGWEFEVLDLDGRRIDRVLVRRATPS
jgi:putative hemolysin